MLIYNLVVKNFTLRISNLAVHSFVREVYNLVHWISDLANHFRIWRSRISYYGFRIWRTTLSYGILKSGGLKSRTADFGFGKTLFRLVITNLILWVSILAKHSFACGPESRTTDFAFDGPVFYFTLWNLKVQKESRTTDFESGRALFRLGD